MNFLLQTVLSAKYNLVPVYDVYQAMGELQKRDSVEIILIDTDYHTQENLDFIQHIKTSGLYQDTSIILLTSEKVMSETSGVADVTNVFRKPFSPQDLTKAIDHVMQQRSVKLI